MITFLKQERGQGLVEYALILVLVAVVLIIAVTMFGQHVGSLFSQVEAQLPSF